MVNKLMVFLKRKEDNTELECYFKTHITEGDLCSFLSEGKPNEVLDKEKKKTSLLGEVEQVFLVESM